MEDDNPNAQTDPLKLWRTMLVGRIERIAQRLDDLDRTLAAVTLACQRDQQLFESWAQLAAAFERDPRAFDAWIFKTTLPPSPPQPGRKVGRPRGSLDRYPRLPRGSLRPNGHAEEG